jgi:hypothetical protein
MTSPCPSCPFRTDIPPFLRPGRAAEILNALIEQDGSFQCHKTIDYSAVGDEEFMDPIACARQKNAQHCAGALILLEKIEKPNQLMRAYERFRAYDRRKLDMTAPVFDTPEQMIDAMRVRTMRRKRRR